jgi:putative ubiquitin-RnfH superfamily antitoxin RatB of RatAB toxin-antitoxin module
MGPAEPVAALAVCVAYSPHAGAVDEVALTLPVGATVRDALLQSRLSDRHPEIDPAAPRVGVWGKLRALDDQLRDQDRVEIYRPLQVDPKEARRLRYRKHRERTKDRPLP